MDNIAVIGVAQTKYERCKPSLTNYDMVYDVASRAMADANCTLADIDNVVTISNDFWDGRTISSMGIQEAAGAHDKNVSTVEGDGTFGAFYGAMRTLGGFRTTLVVAHCKGSEGNSRIITNGMFDPIYHRPLGIDAISSAALQADAYLRASGLTEEQCAKVSVKNHGNARNNSCAQLAMDLTVADVMNSRKIADPLKLLDCSPISDGAAAIVIANQTEADRAGRRPVWIHGIAHCAEAYFLGDRDLANPVALKDAARRAYQIAGIGNPTAEIDVAELYDAFSYMEPLWMEGLGLCEPGRAGEWIDQGKTSINGDLPVNPSGGVLSAHPVLVAGLARIIESVLQIRGEAGAHQVKDVQKALAHGINGPCGQSHCVWILGAEKRREQNA